MFVSKGALSTFYILILGSFVLSCTSVAERERSAFWRYTKPIPYSPTTSGSGVGAASLSTDEEGSVQVNELIQLAETRSPKLLAAYKRWQASINDITTATALPDAMLSYSEFIDSLETRLGPIERRIALDQSIPNPGKLASRQRAAAEEAHAMRANFEATRLGLRESIMIAIADVRELDGKTQVYERLVSIIGEIEAATEARVATGQVTQAEFLRIQTEKDRMESDLASLRLRRPSLVEVLSTVVGDQLPDDIAFPTLDNVRAAERPKQDVLVYYLDSHPALDEDLAKVAVAQAKATEAGWSWVPDFSLGLEYQQIGTPNVPVQPADAGRDALAFRVGITIPWQFHVNDAREEAAEARAEAARYAADQTRLNLKAQLERAVFTFDDAQRLIALYDESVIPNAKQTLELSQTDFTSDKATLTDVLDAERSLLASELSLIGARAQLLRGEARIESLIARELDDVERR